VSLPPQETIIGGSGASFNDPDGNAWELGAPVTVTEQEMRISGRRPPRNSPILALRVPRRASRIR
jgi:hypothetical protein